MRKENDGQEKKLDADCASWSTCLPPPSGPIAEDDLVKQPLVVVGPEQTHTLAHPRPPVRSTHTSQPKQSELAAHHATMRLNILIFATLATLLPSAHGQFFNAIRNIFRPVTNAFQRPGGLFGGGNFQDDGTARPQATGNEELFPSDCGRNVDSGTGKLCFPDGLLCRDRE